MFLGQGLNSAVAVCFDFIFEAAGSLLESRAPGAGDGPDTGSKMNFWVDGLEPHSLLLYPLNITGGASS